MTYGEYLRYCRTHAGAPTKTEFARKLGMLDGDHYIGAENDKPAKKPSLDLMERAAREAGLEFSDFIQEPTKRKRSRKHEMLLNKCAILLELGGQPEMWFESNIMVFYKAFVARLR